MMNGYAMSAWGWLLMTLGMLGFWALVAVLALALLRRPASLSSSRSRTSSHARTRRRSRPSGWPAASSTPTSTASACRSFRRPPVGLRHALCEHLGCPLLGLRVGLLQRSRVIGWLGVVLNDQLQRPGLVLARLAGGQGQGHVDPG
jgi:hypothetical protein